METTSKSIVECKKQKMDIPVSVQVSRGDDLIYEKTVNETGEHNLEILRKSIQITQQDLNSYLTGLVEEEKKSGLIEESKDKNLDIDNFADDDIDNLLKIISLKKRGN